MLRTTESGMTTMIAQSELVVKEVLLALEPISSSIRGEIDQLFDEIFIMTYHMLIIPLQ